MRNQLQNMDVIKSIKTKKKQPNERSGNESGNN